MKSIKINTTQKNLNCSINMLSPCKVSPIKRNSILKRSNNKNEIENNNSFF